MAVQHSYGKMVTDGLVLYLNAADANSYVSGSTTWYDLAGSYNGTLTNGPTYSSANFGSIGLDGTNDLVIVPTSSIFTYGTGNFCVDYWIYINSFTPNSTQAFLDSWGPGNPGIFGFTLTSTQFTTYANNTAIIITGSLNTPTGSWTNITFTRSNGVLYVYQNSNFITSGSCTNNFTMNSFAGRNVTIGANAGLYYGGSTGANGQFANARIGSVKIYKNKALSASEVLQNYNSTKARFGLT